MNNTRFLKAALAAAAFFLAAWPAIAQEVTVYNFTGSPDGSVPECNLIFDSAGNMYGTTNSGGTADYGTVFEISPVSGGGWTEKPLYSFGSQSGDGLQPIAGLVFDAHGNLYGTTPLGGAYGNGTVFELSPGSGGVWTEKIIYSFGNTASDGVNPRRGNLIFDSNGNLYGTTLQGGPNTVTNGGGTEKAGTVFELTPGTGGVWTEKVLYNFGATATDAANPSAGLIFDAAGNLYGTTNYGGAYNSGTAFELSPVSDGEWTETILHSFDDNGTDGSDPVAGLTFDNRGNLYGTTYGGGSNPYYGGFGVVFELSPAGAGNWSEQILYSFNAAAGVGEYPLGGVIFDAAGNLYGTASSQLYGYGEVFELSPGPNGWTENTLYHFGATPDGYAPGNGLVFDTQGNLYGTDTSGGSGVLGLAGTVYQIPHVITASPTFTPPSGAYSDAQSVELKDATANAVIYYSINGGPGIKYSTAISVASSETIQAYATSPSLPPSLVATAGYQIGTVAAAPVFSLAAGTYTTTQSLTITDVAPNATIYYTTNGDAPTTSSAKYTGPIPISATETVEAFAVAAGYTDSPVTSALYTISPLTPPTEDVIFSFAAASDELASQPQSNLIADSAGNLYGTTQTGGASNQGSVFELVRPSSGGEWTEKLLYSFAGTPDGGAPVAGLLFDSAGNLYGTTSNGGTWDSGTVFELSPTTSGPWTEKILHHFDYLTNDGTTPKAGLIFDSKGNLYGTTSGGGANSSANVNPGGTVFELTPASGGAWTESILHSFNYLNTSDGYLPLAGVVFDSKGNLYGTTSDGGASQDSQGGGTVFELTPASGGTWTETVLRSFGGCTEFCTDGYLPKAGVILDSAGNVYGTTSAGGPNGFGADGVAFELSPSTGSTWTETVLHNFGAYETDGTQPFSNLVLDGAGNLYGTTNSGGEYGSGTVFELIAETSGGRAETILHSFNLNGTDGVNPSAGLLLDAANNIYGTTYLGGANASGTAFEIPAVVTPNPVFSLSSGSYAGTQTVTLSDGIFGAAIYYTTNGNTPTTSSSKYSAGITVSASETIKAIAVAEGLLQSGVSSATYQIVAKTPATLTSPASGSQLASPKVTFTWTSAPDSSGYWLFLGTSGAGSKNLYDSGETSATSVTVSSLPTNGATIYIRVYTSFNGTLVYNDYTCIAAKQAVLTSPAPGSTLSATSATFSWTAGTDAAGYWLFLGTTGVGSKNLFDSGETTATSVTFSSLPLNGETIYARVYTSFNGTLVYNDYTYTAAKQAVLTSPTPGSTLPGPSATFTWSPGNNAAGYWLFLGTTGAGSKNLYDSGETTATSITFSSLPLNGETIYARVYTSLNGNLVYLDYSFTAAKQAALTTPTPGTTLSGSTATFDWSAATGSGVQGYWLFLGTTGAGSKNLYDSGETTALTETVSGLPTSGGTVYARIYTSYSGTLTYLDYTYTAK